jgi:hypothetical protein
VLVDQTYPQYHISAHAWASGKKGTNGDYVESNDVFKDWYQSGPSPIDQPCPPTD